MGVWESFRSCEKGCKNNGFNVASNLLYRLALDFYISLTGERIEGLGIVTAAIIAGCFTMLSSIGNTEANIRSLRSSWIEESRKDLAKYIGNARRYLVAAEKCRIKE